MFSSLRLFFRRPAFGFAIAVLAVGPAAGRERSKVESLSEGVLAAESVSQDLLVAHSTAEFWTLASANADRDLSFDMECDVTYYDSVWGLLWIQSGERGEYAVPGAKALLMQSGDRVRVRGVVAAPVTDFSLAGAQIEVIGKALDPPWRLRSAELENLDYRNTLISIEAWVDRQDPMDEKHIRLALSDHGRAVSAIVTVNDLSRVRGLIDCRVRVTGVFAPQADPAGRVGERLLMVPSVDQIQTIGFVGDDPRFEVPLRQISELAGLPGGQLVRLSGELIRQDIGRQLTLRDGSGQIELRSEQVRYLRAKQTVEVVGELTAQDGETTLTEVSFRPASAAVGASTLDPSVEHQFLNLAAQIRELPVNEARAGQVASLRGVVTWSESGSDVFYLQDSSGGIAIVRSEGMPTIAPGGMVDVQGTVVAGDFAPMVKASRITEMGTLAYPRANETTLEQALSGSADAQWVAMRGYVYDVSREGRMNRVGVSTNDGDFVVWVPTEYPRYDWLRSLVRVRGVCRTLTDAGHQLTSIELVVPDESLVKVEDSAPSDPFASPERALDHIASFNPEPAHNNFVKVSGTVLYHVPGSLLYLADRGQILRVQTRTKVGLTPGRRIEAAGQVGRADGYPILREAMVRDVGAGLLPAVENLRPTDTDLRGREGHLVRVEGELINRLAVGSTLRLTIERAGQILDAEMALSGWETRVPADLQIGAMVKLTGVVVPAQFNTASARGFSLAIDEVGGISVVRGPSWWTTQRLAMLAGSLILAVVFVTSWVRVLARRVAAQTSQIKQQLERERQLAEQLQRATRLESLGLLAGGIAHDFNNLLTVVLGNLSMLHIDVPPGSDAAESLTDAEHAVGRARQLTQQLLTFSKGGAPVRVTADLRELLREVTGFALHGTSVRARLQLAEDVWSADVDKGQISQAVQNLVINATQAMSDGGILDVRLINERADEILPESLAPGRYLRLEISDTGCGIPAESLPKIFDPYFSTKESGHGLGLATVFSIVGKHGGDIDVESEVGVGTTFRIWLPAADEPKVEPGSAKPVDRPLDRLNDRPRGRGERVLVMDDEEDIRGLAGKMLRNLGYEPVAVADGEAARRAFVHADAAGAPFDLVILDLTIRGGIGGVETLRLLRHLDPTVRAVVSSGYSADEAVSAHVSHGFDGLIPKPYEIDTFARVVRDVLRRARTRGEAAVISPVSERQA